MRRFIRKVRKPSRWRPPHGGGPDVAIGVAGNAVDSAHQDEVIATAVDRFDSAGLMVRNIGINPVYGPLMKLALDAARKIHEVNCVAALAWVQKLHKTWMAAHGDSIVNVASIAGIRPAPVIAYYGTSKGPC